MSETKKAAPKPKSVAKTAAPKKAATAVKKSAPEKASVAPAVERKVATAKAPKAKRGVVKPTVVAPEQRRQLVQVAAYFIAERRGFESGREVEDWLEAEAEVERMLTEGLITP